MIGLDTNVLARYYVDDQADAEVQRQRLAARRLVESGQPLLVSKSVILELEGVMRGYYGFAQAEVATVMRHLLEQAHITVEDRDAVEQALSNCEAGNDFADALHHASYKSCDSVATFDDRNFAPAGEEARVGTVRDRRVVVVCLNPNGESSTFGRSGPRYERDRFIRTDGVAQCVERPARWRE
jgi:predicted nucleic-acid-binding protein